MAPVNAPAIHQRERSRTREAPRSRADFVLSQQAQKWLNGNEGEVILFLQEMGCVVIESDGAARPEA